MKNKLLYTVLVALAFILTFIAVVWGAYFRSGLAVTEGMPSTMRIRAPRQIENHLANERNRQAALLLAESLEPVFSINPDEWIPTENNLLITRMGIEEIRQEYRQEVLDFQNAQAEWQEEIDAQELRNEQALEEWETARELDPYLPLPQIPLPPPQPEWQGVSLQRFDSLHMVFSEEDRQWLVDMPENEFAMLWAAVLTVAEDTQLNHRFNEIDFLTAMEVQRRIANLTGLDRATSEMVERITLNHLRPNAILDEAQTRANFEAARDNYITVFFVENEILVDEGEIVTADIYHVLGELGMLRSDALLDNPIPLVGVMLLITAVFAVAVMYLMFYQPKLAENKREALLIFTVFALTLALMWTLRDMPILFLPVLIFPLLMSILVDRRAALVLTFPIILICYFVIDGSLTYLLFYLLSGTLLCLLSRFTTERNKVFIVGFLVAIIQGALFFAITMVTERNDAFNELNTLLTNVGFAALNGLLVVIICTGSLPFWESLFGVVTPIKLLDLTNPTNVLLRRLTIEAPGTYHHSLIVANLAETAAFDIGANAHAARVGGYYHDIGKLKNPSFFAENLDGENPHDHMDPKKSVELIIGHVSHGLTLAGEHRLPQFVRDIIKEHQGTTLLQFFYVKAKEKDPDINEQDFRYPFIIPQTRESACVMLADSVEAAVRATIPKLNSIDEIEDKIKKIVRNKLIDGQLEDSGLSIADVSVIEKSFFRVLKGMYHERIAYPKVKE